MLNDDDDDNNNNNNNNSNNSNNNNNKDVHGTFLWCFRDKLRYYPNNVVLICFTRNL